MLSFINQFRAANFSRFLIFAGIGAACLSALIGCSSKDPSNLGALKIRYGSHFNLMLPLEKLQGATLVNAGDTAIKFSDGSTLAPMVITRDLDELPADFELKKYVDYLLDSQTRAEISDADIRDGFERSYAAMKAENPNSREVQLKAGNSSLRGLCEELRCQLFVVQDTQDDQILMISSKGIEPKTIMSLLKDV